MKRAILIVDPQYDFITGSLPVPRAQKAMDALAVYISDNFDKYTLGLVTLDWHPADHESFKRHGGQWPMHCVQYSAGAAVWQPVLDALICSGLPAHYLTKGTASGKEEYSIFQNGASAQHISQLFTAHGIQEVDVCGLAGDICVLSTFEDAVRLYPEITFRILEEYAPRLA